MADFPILTNNFDAGSFKESSENPAVAGGDTEGGYDISRARHTRRPRRTFTFQFADISEAERVILQNFWDARLGGSGAFNWTHPITAVVYNVRFDRQMTMDFSRSGYGFNHRWDSSTITLKEV
jgi:phage-related protein